MPRTVTRSSVPGSTVAQQLFGMPLPRLRRGLSFGIALFSIMYIWLSTSNAAAAVEAEGLQTHIASLDSEYQKLLVAQTHAESLSRLQEFAQKNKMTNTTQTAYIAGDDTVAVR